MSWSRCRSGPTAARTWSNSSTVCGRSDRGRSRRRGTPRPRRSRGRPRASGSVADPRPAAVAAHLAADREDARLAGTPGPRRGPRPARGRRRGDRPSPPRGTCRPTGRRRGIPATLPLMSQSAMSTPAIALLRTGPLRQYEFTDISVPQVLDVAGVPADEERREVLVDRARHEGRSLGERRAAEAVEAGLVGVDPDDDERDPLGRGQDGADAGDLHSARRLAATGIVALQYDRHPKSAFSLPRVRRRAPRRRPGRRPSSAGRGRPAPSRAAGVFLPRDGARPASPSSARSDRTRRGRRAHPRRGRPARPRRDRAPEHRRRAGRQRLDRAKQRQPAGVDRGQQHAERRLDAADPVRRLRRTRPPCRPRCAGAWSVAMASAVPSRSAARQAAASSGARSGGFTRSDDAYGAATIAPSRPRVAADPASHAHRRAPATHSSVSAR